MRKGILIVSAFIVIMLAGFYFFWHPSVKIIYAEDNGQGYSDIVVNELPYSDKGKIEWYLSSVEKLAKQFKIPSVSPYGTYVITVWSVGEGFTNEKYSPHDDLFCFEKMSVEKNCVVKKPLLTVRKDVEQNATYSPGDSDKQYILSEKGITLLPGN